MGSASSPANPVYSLTGSGRDMAGVSALEKPMKKSLVGVKLGFFAIMLGMTAMSQTKSIILDVRTAEEFQEGHLINAKNLDWYQPNFKDEVAKYDKHASYKIYCRSGNRSGQAVKLMTSLGFKNVENLGSVADASHKLKIACEGPKGC